MRRRCLAAAVAVVAVVVVAAADEIDVCDLSLSAEIVEVYATTAGAWDVHHGWQTVDEQEQERRLLAMMDISRTINLFVLEYQDALVPSVRRYFQIMALGIYGLGLQMAFKSNGIDFDDFPELESSVPFAALLYMDVDIKAAVAEW